MAETPHERRQYEEAARIMRRAMPQAEKIMNELASQQRYMTEIGEVFAKQYQDLFKDILPKLEAFLPTFDVPAFKVDFPVPADFDLLPKLDIPALKLDYSALFPDFAAISEKAVEALKPSLEFIHELQRDQFADLIAAARKAAFSSLPPNWRDDRDLDPDGSGAVSPRRRTAIGLGSTNGHPRSLFAAATPQERRSIIGRSWKRIGEACVAELDRVDGQRLKGHVKFARTAARSLPRWLAGGLSGAEREPPGLDPQGRVQRQ